MLRLRFVLLALSLTSCYDSFDSPHGSEWSSPPPNADIADLHACYYGETVTIGEPIVIRGRVTSDDTAGNFYRTLLIQDRTGGVEIMAGLSDLHTSYPPGYAVTVIARGLAIGERYGVLRLGLPPLAGDLLPDYIGAPALLDRHLVRGDGPQPVEPLVLALADLTQSRCGMLVEIRGLDPPARSGGGRRSAKLERLPAVHGRGGEPNPHLYQRLRPPCTRSRADGTDRPAGYPAIRARGILRVLFPNQDARCGRLPARLACGCPGFC